MRLDEAYSLLEARKDEFIPDFGRMMTLHHIVSYTPSWKKMPYGPWYTLRGMESRALHWSSQPECNAQVAQARTIAFNNYTLWRKAKGFPDYAQARSC